VRGGVNITVFEIVKDSVDIVDAAQRYGLDVSRHKKALCPFHSDTHPSLSFKRHRYKCFVCGAGGDVIDLVGRLANTAPLETVRELNQTFGLHIDIDKPVPSGEVQRRKRLQEQKKAFEDWEQNAWKTVNAYFHLLRDWQRLYAPKRPEDELDPRFVESLHQSGYIEHILEAMFIKRSMAEKLAFRNDYHQTVERIAQRMKERCVHHAGIIGTGDNSAGIVFPFKLTGAESFARVA